MSDAPESHPSHTTAESGAPSGEPRPLDADPVRKPAAPESLAQPPEAPRAEPDASGSASSAVYCSRCQLDVVPQTPGHCPRCGGWVFDNTGALSHGLRSKKLAAKVDAYRVDLLDQLFAERGGKDALDMVSRIAIENYALVCAQAKTIEGRLDETGLFTRTGRRRSAFDMLKGISETIDRLRAELPPIKQNTPAVPLEDLSTADLVARLEALTARAKALLEFESRPRVAEPPLIGTESSPIVERAPVSPAECAPTPAMDLTCPYCHQTPCVGRDHHAYEALHYTDPEEVKRRDDGRTKEMRESLRRGCTPWTVVRVG